MSAPYYADDSVTLHHGDCLDVLAEMPDNSVDAIVTDPPYGLEFMGKEWDSFRDRPANASGPQTDTWGTATNQTGAYAATLPRYTGKKGASLLPFQIWCQEWMEEALRVLKPGGHLLAFGGTRTWHRLAVAVEDAGFEVRDSIAWLYGSGFPKSLDVSKAIDKQANASPVFDEIRTHIREWRDRAGMTNTQLNEALGLETRGCGMARHWTSEKGGQHLIPSKDQWVNLKGVLGWPDCEFDTIYDAVKDGAERPVLSTRRDVGGRTVSIIGKADAADYDITAPATPAAQQWQGWGTALKPAFEPIVVARKPLVGTVAANVLAHGTGALNIDGTRVGFASEKDRESAQALAELRAKGRRLGVLGEPGQGASLQAAVSGDTRTGDEPVSTHTAGRWPANVLLDGDAAAELDEQTGTLTSGKMQPTHTTAGVNGRGTYGADAAGGFTTMETYGDSGGASRFFPTFRYEAKAPTAERPRHGEVAHPTVKPLDLMRWLVRLVTPPGGTVLEPFAGSGTTAEACVIEGFRCVAIEREAAYLPLITARLSKPIQPDLFGGAA